MPRELLKGPLQKPKSKTTSQVREIGNMVVINTTVDEASKGGSRLFRTLMAVNAKKSTSHGLRLEQNTRTIS